MFVRDYISQKFSSFGVRLTEADFLDMAITYSIDMNWTLTAEIKDSVDRAYVQFIPSILSRPDVSEGGMAISWDRAAVKEHYSFMCRLLKMPDMLRPTIKIRG